MICIKYHWYTGPALSTSSLVKPTIEPAPTVSPFVKPYDFSWWIILVITTACCVSCCLCCWLLVGLCACFFGKAREKSYFPASIGKVNKLVTSYLFILPPPPPPPPGPTHTYTVFQNVMMNDTTSKKYCMTNCHVHMFSI